MKTIFAVETGRPKELRAIFLNIPHCTISCWGDDVFWVKISDPKAKFSANLEICRSLFRPFFTICRDQFRLQRLGVRSILASLTKEEKVKGLSFDERFAWLYPRCYHNGNVCDAHNKRIKGMMPHFYINDMDSDGDHVGTVELRPLFDMGTRAGYDTHHSMGNIRG
ncbi:Oidioi.mRNA.OKI2018_I69.chr2.g6532.t1.cds [Oikopleura dioica]|uniref:Oidioi.mRNA.OKI2018_I69.chr2.g6532.t1.cds n=1 Tax=Oikopleura dioica TaxID=34765 RepID=A0ABN7T3S3_OIKDI|nr:Oidioi.mRNA.OKI2018_I69.chr2.g6532.t1.cds [Oikopleura dioica]